MNGVKGYKVFEPDWTCRGFQYEVGQLFEEDVEPVCCNRGFHYCKELKDCFNYYPFNSENKVAVIEALGDIDEPDGDSKCCTNKIRIVQELTWQEVLTLVNTGKDCTGFCNTGDWNTGNRNTGNRNTGDWNTGDWNTGDCNTGDWNTGNRNTGDWNTTNFSSGCFNTAEEKITLFEKPSDWTYRDWLNSYARELLCKIPKNVVEWIYTGDMTEKEKAANPTYETTGGYLKVFDESECAQIWWDGLDEADRKVIKSIPNFDAEIFRKCTGIDIGK